MKIKEVFQITTYLVILLVVIPALSFLPLIPLSLLFDLKGNLVSSVSIMVMTIIYLAGLFGLWLVIFKRFLLLIK